MEKHGAPPCINLAFVALPEDGKTDPYGEQIERASSVVHGSCQPVKMGYYFEFPDE